MLLIEFFGLQLLFYIIPQMQEVFEDVILFLSHNNLMYQALILFHSTDGEHKSQDGEVTCGRFQLIVTGWASEACVLPTGPGFFIRY